MIKELVFDPKHDFPRRKPERRYLLLSSPRTGSNMLADGLYQSQLAGYPIEYLNERALRSLSGPLTSERLFGYIDDVCMRRTTPNGVFGLKMHFHQFANLFISKSGVSLDGRKFLSLFSNAILLNRRDRISQALSYVIALETEKWQSIDSADMHGSKIQIDNAKVLKILDEIEFLVRETLSWRQLIREEKMNAIEVCYEDLVNDYQKEIDRVMEFLGLPKVRVQPRTVKLSGEDTLKAKAEFLSKIGA